MLAIALSACSLSSGTRYEIDLAKPAVLPTGQPVDQAPQQAPSVLRGAAIYEQKCAACHGVTGAGDGPQAADVRAQGKQVANLVEPSRARNAQPKDWYAVVSTGRLQALMPGFAGSLSPQDRWDVVSYVWALAAPAASVESGKQLFSAQCAACHAQPAQLMPANRLGQAALSDLVAAMTRGEPHKSVTLSDAQRWPVADYVRASGYQWADIEAIKLAAIQGDGVLSYRAANVTRGGAPVANLEVTLHAYDPRSEVFSRTARADSSGIVAFAGLPRRPDYFFEPEAIADGGRFFGDMRQLTNTLSVTGSLPVYDVTSDSSAIRIADWHYVVQDGREGVLSVVEIYFFENASGRAYVSQPGRSIRVSVPADARNLRFDGPGIGARFAQDGNILYDMDAMLPGASVSPITMIYEIPYRGTASVTRDMYYPVKQWDVVLPATELHATGLTDRGVQKLTTTSVHLYAPDVPGAPAPGPVRFGLAGALRAAPPAGSDTRSGVAAIVVLLFALAVPALIVARARALRRGNPAQAQMRAEMLDAIADLDARHAQGGLADEAYAGQRARLVNLLRSIWEPVDAA